jgi:hypothetical protein
MKKIRFNFTTQESEEVNEKEAWRYIIIVHQSSRQFATVVKIKANERERERERERE